MKIPFISLLILYSTLSITQAYAETITLFTGKLPPFTISEEEKGISHEILEQVAIRADLEIEFNYLPWKRAQVEAQATPNSLIATMIRSKSREEKYTWIAPILDSQTAFISLTKPVNSFEEGQALKKVAVLRSTPRERNLIKQNFGNLHTVNGTELAARLLNGGRVDAWYTIVQRAAFVFKSEGYNPGSLVVGKPTSVASLWLASNKTFDSALAQRIAAAVEEFRETPEYQAILDKYSK